MPIDQTLRGLALEIDASTEPAPETQPLLEYRFINLANTQTILARIKGIPLATGGGELAFETNAGADTTTPRMLIDDQGNVGIGTEDPRAKLEVAGDVKLSGPLTVEGALTVSGVAEMGGDLSVTGKVTAAGFAGDGADLSNVTPAEGSVTNTKLAQDAASLSKVTGGSMVVSSGNVGIGTENPISKVHILSGASDVLPPRLQSSATTSFAAGWDFYHEATGKGYVGVPGSATGIAPGEMLLFGSAGTGISLWAGGNRSVTIDTNGNVGIGTTNPLRMLQIGSSIDSAFGIEPSDGSPNAGYIRFGDNTGWKLHFGRDREASIATGAPLNTGPTGLLMTIQDDGTVIVQGAVRARSFPTTSDAKYKTHITPLTNVLAQLDKLHAIAFSWNELSESQDHRVRRREIGVIAQEVETVFPELVTTGDGGDKAVDYGRLSAVLLEAVKELKACVEELAQKVAPLPS